MSHRPIIDAGPGLNFFSTGQERLLISVLGRLSAPETVQNEVFRKAQQDERFRAAERVWRKLAPTDWLQVLSDDQTPELAAVVHRVTRQRMEARLRQSKDLGEIMVIAHAVVAAESGDSVTVLIDDGEGARMAASEIRRLNRLKADGHAVGSIGPAGTLEILQRGAALGHIPDKAAMRDIYGRLRGLDDGLPPIDTTSLLDPGTGPHGMRAGRPRRVRHRRGLRTAGGRRDSTGHGDGAAEALHSSEGLETYGYACRTQPQGGREFGSAETGFDGPGPVGALAYVMRWGRSRRGR